MPFNGVAFPNPPLSAPWQSSLLLAASSGLGIPAIVLAAYQQAAAAIAVSNPSCHLGWQILAGIGKVESDHAEGGAVSADGTALQPILGPVLDGSNGTAAVPDTDHGRLDGNTTWDRAVGPMQFLPGTWATWGATGRQGATPSPENVFDAALAAGRYLCANGGDLGNSNGLDSAIMAYNHSMAYLANVLSWISAYSSGPAVPAPWSPGTGTAGPSATATPPGAPAAPTATPGTAAPSASPPAASAPTPTAAGPTSSSTPTTPSSVPAPLGIAGNWHQVFGDEFSGSTIDAAKWVSNGPGCTSCTTAPPGGTGSAAFAPSQVSVGGGSLHLTAAQQSVTGGGQTYPYLSGMVQTDGKEAFTFGAFEARIYLPASGSKIANWPAFLTSGQNPTTDGEMDVLDGLAGSACYRLGSAPGTPSGCPAGDFTGWHTYGADWEPGSVTFYFDGAEVGQVTTGVGSSPMYLVLDNAVGGSGGPTQAPADMQVDYVRVWQH